MENLVLIITGVLSLFIGILVGYLLFLNKINSLKLENVRLSEINKNYEFMQKNSDDISKKLQDDFKAIANQALIDNQNQLSEQSKISLDEKLKPLSEVLKNYQEKIDKFNIESAKDNATLKTEIEKLIENTKEAHTVTKNLTNALTLSQNKKGEFGEGALEVILNCCGFEENIHYTKHFSSHSIDANNELKRVFPDFVINLPDNKNIVIDSKMNFKNFLDFQNAETATEKETCLKAFKNDIKNTIKDLSKKNYQNAKNINSPDFVFMYVPLESSLAVIYEDISLINFAYENNIILIGNISLLTTLRLVRLLLSEEKQRESVIEIANTGSALYEKFASLCGDIVSIQKKFLGVEGDFKTLIGRFQRGEDSLFKSVEKLKTMGIITTKEIPQEFLEEAE